MKASLQTPPEGGQLNLIATKLDLEAAASGDETPSPRRFTMTAYTGGPMKLAGWRHPVVVDLQGLAIGDQSRPILLDHAHDVESVMGQTDEIAASETELLVTGQILGDSPKARQVIALADKGFSWRASIGARADKVEFVPAGAQAPGERPVVHRPGLRRPGVHPRRDQLRGPGGGRQRAGPDRRDGGTGRGRT